MNPPLKYRALLAGDVGRLLHVEAGTVKRMVQRGDLVPTWISSGRYIFAWGDLVIQAKRLDRFLAPIEILDDDPDEGEVGE